MRYAILLAALFAPAALAAPAATSVSATLATPASSARVTYGSVSWSCAGATCTAAPVAARLGDARACRDLAKQVGALTAFDGLRGALGAEDLAKCNRSAKPAA